jgi:HAD superfamily hydrolase (TIGR01458 family)
MPNIEGVLLDIDGVLAISWEAIPGAVDALGWLRAHGVPFRLITNTTTHSRADLAATLRESGLDVEPDEIITAVVATASYLRAHHPGARCALLSDGDAAADLEGVRIVALEDEDEDVDVMVIGGASDDFSYANMNQVFRRVMDGAALVGMHRNMYWRTADGLELDGGAYIAGLEEATGAIATICGKPAPAFFNAALEMLGVPADRVAMLGDDLVNDVLGAQAVGITGVLVKTGKFLPSDLDGNDPPDRVIGSIAEIDDLLEPR